MKCIVDKVGKVRRVSDGDARRLVDEAKASYVEKKAWKDAGRP